MQHNYFMYITTNYERTVLYCGITNNLQARLIEHYLNRIDTTTFAGKYECYYLIYYERYQWVQHAISREKEVKGWTREKKLQLITSFNPEFKFLNDEICGKWPPPSDSEKRTSYN
jgi:putative endonuclease